MKSDNLQSLVIFGRKKKIPGGTTRYDGLVVSKKRGYVFPMILFATLAVGMFIVTITQFQSSTRLKYQHLNDYQSAFNVAYAALVEVLADIQSKQWSNRSFKAGPVNKNADLFGGSYNLRVEDHDSVEFMFNVKVRVTYKNKKHLFYWRLCYNPNLLDFTQLVIPIFYEDFSNSPMATADPDDLDDYVDKKIENREDNLPKVNEIANNLKPSSTIEEALKKVGIDPENVRPTGQERPPATTVNLPDANLPLKEIEQLLAEISPEVAHVIKALHFGGDVAELDADQKVLLEALAEILGDRPDVKIELRGHTTGVVGTPESNMIFSIELDQFSQTTAETRDGLKPPYTNENISI